VIGTTAGTRLMEIESAYIGAFFDEWLKGEKGELLNGPSAEFPR
jgi:hypothetical protein